MQHATVVIDPDFVVSPIDRRIFGSFVEHMGRCVYTGIFEPGHRSADGDGLRADVAELVREMGVSVVRYPGGNFVSGYRWEDGVGPLEVRPARLDLAWQARETNHFGTNEFLGWARDTGVEPMMAVNLGTRGVQEAADLVEYCNHPGGSALSDLRAHHGVPDPHRIGLWCLGNEMDGPWQIGHKSAQEYGILAREAGRAMKLVDPGIELIACGSSNAQMPTFAGWEATVLGECYDQVEYLSLHAYYGQAGQDLPSFLASAVDMDAFIAGVVATADHVRARLHRSKRIRLSFDEWNVWHTDTFEGGSWEEAPRLSEDRFDVADAVVAGDLLMTLLRHADRVAIACLAQLVNLLGPIRTEPGGPSWRDATFHPFALTAAHARGEVLYTPVRSPRHETESYGEVDAVDVVVTHDPEAAEIVVFAVNRDISAPTILDVDLRGLRWSGSAIHTALSDDDPHAANTVDDPGRVVPRTMPVPGGDGPVAVELPPLSWNMIRLPVDTRFRSSV